MAGNLGCKHIYDIKVGKYESTGPIYLLSAQEKPASVLPFQHHPWGAEGCHLPPAFVLF